MDGVSVWNWGSISTRKRPVAIRATGQLAAIYAIHRGRMHGSLHQDQRFVITTSSLASYCPSWTCLDAMISLSVAPRNDSRRASIPDRCK